MHILDPVYMAIAFWFAAFAQAEQGKIEHAVTRSFIAIWFFGLIFLGDNLSIDFQRNIARWLVLLLAIVEIISWGFRKIICRRSMHGSKYK